MGQVHNLKGTPDLIDISKEIYKVKEELRPYPGNLNRFAREYAKAEHKYRIALEQEILKLKSEGMPATLIRDVARGRVADLKFKRDKAQSLFRACLAAAEVKKTELSGLQSIKNHLDEV